MGTIIRAIFHLHTHHCSSSGHAKHTRPPSKEKIFSNSSQAGGLPGGSRIHFLPCVACFSAKIHCDSLVPGADESIQIRNHALCYFQHDLARYNRLHVRQSSLISSVRDLAQQFGKICTGEIISPCFMPLILFVQDLDGRVFIEYHIPRRAADRIFSYTKLCIMITISLLLHG